MLSGDPNAQYAGYSQYAAYQQQGGAGSLAGVGADTAQLQQMYAAGLPISDPNFAIAAHPYGYSNAPDARCCASPSNDTTESIR